MIKVFSIVFQSKTNPEQIGIYTTPDAVTYGQAVDAGLQKLITVRGDLQWTALISNTLDINAEMKVKEIAPMPEVKIDKDEKTKESKNWLLNIIVKHKDKKLLSACYKYLTMNEIALINDKLK
mgnify:CR=1 FL=1